MCVSRIVIYPVGNSRHDGGMGCLCMKEQVNVADESHKSLTSCPQRHIGDGKSCTLFTHVTQSLNKPTLALCCVFSVEV